MDRKFYVSLKAEELLKEKGCPINGRITKAEAIDWLESKGIIVELSYDNQAHMDNARWNYFIYTHDNDGWVEALVCSWYENDFYQTRLEAEEAAIIKALEIL